MSDFKLRGFNPQPPLSPGAGRAGSPPPGKVSTPTTSATGLAARGASTASAPRSARLPFDAAAELSMQATRTMGFVSASANNFKTSAKSFFKSMNPSTMQALSTQLKGMPPPDKPLPPLPSGLAPWLGTDKPLPALPTGAGPVRQDAISTQPTVSSMQSQPNPGADGLSRKGALRRAQSFETAVGLGKEKPAILSENPNVASFLDSKHPMDIGMKKEVLSEKFQDKASFNAFLDRNLGGSISDKLNAPASEWSVETFQALYVANWANHPVEKGSYMIDLSGVSPEQLEQIRTAHKEHCTSRPSSHLSGEGRSASKGWDFMKGYSELLVQMETIDNKPYLFLKAEGHTTGLDGIVGHTKSYFHKVKTGEGLMANPYLNALANASPLVEGRAAENYAKNYGKLLKGLELDAKSKTVSTREMAQALFEKSGFQPGGQQDAAGFVQGATNQQIGEALMQYSDDASSGRIETRLKGDKVATEGMMKELREVAQSLIADGDTRQSRVHREIITTPAELDNSISAFVPDGGSSLRRQPAIRRHSVD